MKKSGAIFDLDGTLMDARLIHDEAWIKTFDTLKIKLSAEEMTIHPGRKNQDFIKLICEARKITDCDYDLMAKRKDYFVKEIVKSTKLEYFPGVVDFLHKLRDQGIKIALATSAFKDIAEMFLKDLIQIFDVRIFNENVEKSKPDPEVFLKAALGLNLEPSQCIVFEDAESGVLAAKTGGFFCVAKENHAGQDLKSADLVIDQYNPTELLKLFTG